MVVRSHWFFLSPMSMSISGTGKSGRGVILISGVPALTIRRAEGAVTVRTDAVLATGLLIAARGSNHRIRLFRAIRSYAAR
jgi:hypothetical protein